MTAYTLIFTLAIFAFCHGTDIFDDILPEYDICNNKCSANNTSQSSLVSECQRGCRFHIIEEFIAKDQNVSQVNNGCHSSCVESYGDESLATDGCNNGCDIQQEIFVGNLKKTQLSDEGPFIHMLSPLMQVRAVYSSVVGAVRIIRTSVITYFISDDDSIVAVESEPEIIVGFDPDVMNNPLQTQQQEQSRQLAMDGENEEPSVVKCMSRQIGVPPYILVASVVALVVFSLYIIIALCSTKSTSKAKALASGKNMHIDPLPLPVKLVRPEDLTTLSLTEEEDLQAPPLPSKIKLTDTLI